LFVWFKGIICMSLNSSVKFAVFMTILIVGFGQANPANACWAYIDNISREQLRGQFYDFNPELSLEQKVRVLFANDGVFDIPLGFLPSRRSFADPNLEQQSVSPSDDMIDVGIPFYFCFPDGRYPLEDMATAWPRIISDKTKKSQNGGIVTVEARFRYVSAGVDDPAITLDRAIENTKLLMESRVGFGGRKLIREVRYGLQYYEIRGLQPEPEWSKSATYMLDANDGAQGVNLIARESFQATEVEVYNPTTKLKMWLTFPTTEMNRWQEIYDLAKQKIESWRVK
jgi:hypothetical protein